MANELKENEAGIPDSATKGLVAAFPYLMVMTSWLLMGLFFLCVNVPLILQLISNKQPRTLPELIEDLEKGFGPVVGSPSLGSFLLLCFLLALIIGSILQPFALLLTMLASVIFTGVRKVVQKKSSPPDYYKAAPFQEGYAKFADWMQRHRLAKLTWEWELFNHYLYAGVAANVCVFVAVLLFLWRPAPGHYLGCLVKLFLVLFVLALYVHSYVRSTVVEQMHKYYSGQCKLEPSHGTK